MNQTPRGLNRVFIAIFALILLGLGALALALAVLQPFVDWWSVWAPGAYRQLMEVSRHTALAPGSSSWLWGAVAVAVVIILIVMISWMASQGRGRTTLLIQEQEDPHDPDQVPGTVSINGSVAEQLLRQSLGERPELLGVSVSTYAIKRVPALRIRAYPRHGVSPLAVTQAVQESVRGLETLLGEPIPVLLNVRSATRARFSRAERVK